MQSGGESLTRKPTAPARSAAKTYSSRSNVVRIDDRLAAGGPQPARRFEPVHARHPDVDQQDVGARRRGPSASRPSTASPTTSMSGAASRMHPQAVAGDRLVVGDARRGCFPRATSRQREAARTEQPPSRRSGRERPPTIATRSRIPGRPDRAPPVSGAADPVVLDRDRQLAVAIGDSARGRRSPRRGGRRWSAPLHRPDRPHLELVRQRAIGPLDGGSTARPAARAVAEQLLDVRQPGRSVPARPAPDSRSARRACAASSAERLGRQPVGWRSSASRGKAGSDVVGARAGRRSERGSRWEVMCR